MYLIGTARLATMTVRVHAAHIFLTTLHELSGLGRQVRIERNDL